MSYGNADIVQLGACYVYYGPAGKEAPMGYTQGNVSVSYSTEKQEVNVDQESAPIRSQITVQSISVKCPFAEQDLARMSRLLPGATFVVHGLTYEGGFDAAATYAADDCVDLNGVLYKATDVPTGTPGESGATNWAVVADSVKRSLTLSGASTASDSVYGQLILKPSLTDANTWLTLPKAAPSPQFDYSYDPENVRVIEIEFTGLVSDSKLVIFGDSTAVAAT